MRAATVAVALVILAGCVRPTPGPVTAADTSGSWLPGKVRFEDGGTALVYEPRSPWLDTKVFLPDNRGVLRVERRHGYLPDRVVEGD